MSPRWTAYRGGERMKKYLYDGETNAPMNGASLPDYGPEIKDGKMVIIERIEEPLPFTDPPSRWELEAEEEGYE